MSGVLRLPQVVAHRGASEQSPEHTLGAYVRAIEAGVDALECDVRLTRDGHLVCVHDRRVERTSNGRGIVSTLELAELERLDWGSWHQRADEDEMPDRDSSRLLTLPRLLSVVLDAGRRIEVAIETKHPTRYAGLVERRLVETLDRFGLAHTRRGTAPLVRVMSFSQLSLRRMRLLAPGVPTILLMDPVPLRFRDGHLPPRVGGSGPSIEVIRAHPRYVERVHRHGGQVHVWTVNTPADADLCVAAGVDAIISNRPAEIREYLLHAASRGGDRGRAS